MNRNIILYILKSIILMFLLSCVDNGNKSIKEENLNLENFEEFLSKFKSDDKFRISRISYPLEGYNSDDNDVLDEDKKAYFWNEQEVGHYLNESYSSDDFITQIVFSTDTLIKERVYIEGSGFEVIKHFSLIDGKWFLTYFFYRN